MSEFQIVGLIMLLFGIISLLFCRRFVNLIRYFYSVIGINISQWALITGLFIGAIIFIFKGVNLIVGK